MKMEIEADAAQQQPNTTDNLSHGKTGMDRRKFVSLTAARLLALALFQGTCWVEKDSFPQATKSHSPTLALVPRDQRNAAPAGCAGNPGSGRL